MRYGSPGTLLLNNAMPLAPATVAVVLAPGVPPWPLALVSVTFAPFRPVPLWSFTMTVRVPLLAELAQPVDPDVGSKPSKSLPVGVAATQIGPWAPRLV